MKLDFCVRHPPYEKVDHGKNYPDAHQAALTRENNLRDQRPYLKHENPGAGPGDTYNQLQGPGLVKVKIKK
jgi:hypothetical protein